ncbi:MAG: hypothetical protein KAZ17_02905, partial [Sphingorhabdus sp.]|nr:hypothetical protein [Sphingorhabdus sp.]
MVQAATANNDTDKDTVHAIFFNALIRSLPKPYPFVGAMRLSPWIADKIKPALSNIAIKRPGNRMPGLDYFRNYCSNGLKISVAAAHEAEQALE